ncbi:hypothetical protein LguiA_003628 [Lonicera macranthoides]
MSRCFPYPPPGSSGKRLYDEALIESIKLQREREKSKAERKKEKRRENKEKKREKREKKREKKEKAKLNPSKTSHDQQARKLDESSADYGAEQLERSDLTEEYGQPVDSNNPCNSSDSTQNSNKRKRDSSSSNGDHIRTPLQKHKEADALASKEQLCSPKDSTPIGSATSFEDEMRRLCWVFPPLKNEEPEFDDLEWLFRRKIQNSEKKFRSGREVSCCGNSTLWPRAHYLAEADIYTLPYTVPF